MTPEEFVLARLTEREESARSVPGDDAGWWAAEIIGAHFGRPGEDTWIVDSHPSLISYEVVSAEVAQFIESRDPSRLLLECEVLREVVATATPRTVRTLARTWFYHPDYQKEWETE